MTTFSQLIDDLIVETSRPDMIASMSQYASQTIRELHAEPTTGNVLGYASNLVEIELTADLDEAFVYTLPKPHLFQNVEAVYYPQPGRYATQRYPSSTMAYVGEVDAEYYWYRVGSDLVFSGYGGIDSLIDLAYYQFPRKLTYYKVADRPATWNDTTESYTYKVEYDVDDTTRATARDLVSNWLYERWEEAIKQGVRAKIYARLSDVDRARLAYSLYQSARPQIIAAETYERGVIRSR